MNQAGDILTLQTLIRAIVVAWNQNSFKSLDGAIGIARAELARLDHDHSKGPRLTKIVGGAAS